VVVERLPGRVDHSTAAWVYERYGEALLAAGEPERAEAMLRTAMDDSAFTAESAQASRVRVLNALAQAVVALGQPAEAVVLCERVLRLRRELHGELHPGVAEAMRGLGRVCRAAGRLGDALTWLNRSNVIWKRLGGTAADPAELALTQSDLALC